jgi:lipopolysaccharide biosynthesis protein
MYVVKYIEELKKVADDIIFVSDCDLSTTEIQKISHLCLRVIAYNHGESNDFGSYKRGLIFLKNKLDQYDEIILANDSCYCVNFFAPIFDKMKNVKCDFWGMTDNKEKGVPHHLQSYFIVFKKSVFTHEAFYFFFENLKKQKNKIDIILLYEVGLTNIFSNFYNFKYCSVFEKQDKHNPSVGKFALSTVKNGNPLLKIELLRDNPLKVLNLYKWKEEIDISIQKLIIFHLKRTDFNFMRWYLKKEILWQLTGKDLFDLRVEKRLSGKKTLAMTLFNKNLFQIKF